MLDWSRQVAPRAKVAIKPVTGLQDIYLIFKNPEAKGEEVLMSIIEIEFKNAKVN